MSTRATQDVLQRLAIVPLEELAELIATARSLAPGDPRIAAAESRRQRLVNEKKHEDDRFDHDARFNLGEVLHGVEKAFSVTLPRGFRRVWASWEHREADNLRRDLVIAFRKLGRISLIVPGARETKIAEMVRIARELKRAYFADEQMELPFLPFARESNDAWLGLWLVSRPTSSDFAVVRVSSEGPSVIAQSTEEWLS